MNNGVNMDRGPVMFTSDVSLSKDDKTAMLGKQITDGQLTGLREQTNANYVIQNVQLSSLVTSSGRLM